MFTLCMCVSVCSWHYPGACGWDGGAVQKLVHEEESRLNWNWILEMTQTEKYG